MSDISIALMMAFIFTTITATIGAFIKFVIWKNGKTPRNAFEYGKSWAAYIAFFVPISTFSLFLKKSFLEGLISLGICLIVFPLLGFFCGYLYGLIKTKPTLNNSSNSSLPENVVPVQTSSTSPVTKSKSKKEKDSYSPTQLIASAGVLVLLFGFIFYTFYIL
jgi:hypothetical protein